MTEDEAKAKWCPFARASNLADLQTVAINREGNAPDQWCMCIASACMAWRWGVKRNPNYRGSMIHETPDTPPRIPDDEQGYCGLAGVIDPWLVR